MTALGFDPRAVLKMSKQGHPLPNPPNPPPVSDPKPATKPLGLGELGDLGGGEGQNSKTRPPSDPSTALKVETRGCPLPKPPNPPNPASNSDPSRPPATPEAHLEGPRLGGLVGIGVRQGQSANSAKRVEFLLRAAEEASWALAGPEIGPVLETGAVDHDEAERMALAASYAEPETAPQAALVYCFPCGKPVVLRDRTWSEAGGWCCAACAAKRATIGARA